MAAHCSVSPIAKRHYRLKLADALEAHDLALTLGGMLGVPHPGLIESAIARPYNGYYRRIHQKAAALVESLASNHGFADGNKRTTIILMHMLITKSDYRLVSLDDQESLERAAEQMVLDVVNHDLPFDQLVEWFRLRIRRI